MNVIGKTLILFGIVLIAVGIIFILGVRIPWFGKLPGDICIQKKNFSFFFPFTTCVILSIVATLILFLISRR